MTEQESEIFEISGLSKLLQENNVRYLGKHEKYSTHDMIESILEADYQNASFYVVDLGEIIRRHKRWVNLLPNVEPFYAVKCNPNNVICQLMALLKTGFDVASKNEINIVKDNVDKEKIIYAHPYKDWVSLQYAKSTKVNLSVFDSTKELLKIKLFHPQCKLLLRIKVDDTHSQCKLNEKFGIETDDTSIDKILKYAKFLDLNVCGVCFHVGSDCSDPQQYQKAISTARKVFDMGKQCGFDMNMLDIGGGFPGKNGLEYDNLFESMCNIINKSLEEFFGGEKAIENLRVIAEPGRYFVQASHILVMNVIGERTIYNRETNSKECLYYVNDGVYGSFNCIFFDHQKPEIIPYIEIDEKKYKSVVFGRTCDSIDKITDNIELPKLDIGDYCYVQNFGAYTVAAATSFNGFPNIKSYYVLTS